MVAGVVVLAVLAGAGWYAISQDVRPFRASDQDRKSVV